MSFDSNTPIKILDFKALRQICPLSRVQIGRLEAQGRWPRRVQYSPGRVGWIEAEIQEHLRARAALRDQKKG